MCIGFRQQHYAGCEDYEAPNEEDEEPGHEATVGVHGRTRRTGRNGYDRGQSDEQKQKKLYGAKQTPNAGRGD